MWSVPLQRIRRMREGGTDGFTLIEMVVTLFLVTMALGALASTLIAASLGNHASEQRAKANQYAAQCLEQAMSTTWSALAPGTSACSVPSPFSATQTVAWVGNGTGYDYKHIAVAVAWTTAATTRTVSVDGLRAPTTSEVAPPEHNPVIIPALTLSSTGITPASETLQSNGALSQDVTLTVTTSRAASSVLTTFATTTGNQTVALTGDANQTTWTLTIHTTDPYLFNSGPEAWSITATGSNSAPANGSISNTLNPYASATTTMSAGNPAPATQQLDSNDYLSNAITFQATTSAAVSTVVVSWTDKNGVPRSLSLTGATGGTTWSGTLAAGSGSGAFNPGTQTFTFTATASGQSIAPVTKSVGLSAPLGQISVDTFSMVGAPNNADEVCISKSGTNNNNPWQTEYLQFTIHNPGTSNVSVTWTNNTATSPAVALVTTNADGSMVYQATVPTTAVFKDTTTTFTVSVSRTDGANAAPTHQATVVSVSSSGSC
jgi:Tfp pilus assembly protein PilV